MRGARRRLPRKAPAFGLVRVGDENGHRDVARQAHDDLRRRAQVDGGLDRPLDRRPAVAGRVLLASDIKLLRPDHGVTALARGEAVSGRLDLHTRVEADARVVPRGLLDHGGHQVRDADESGDEGCGRALVDGFGSIHLLDPAAVHHRDPVGHRERLLLVVRHVDERDPDVALDPLQLQLQGLTELQVEGAEGLVEQQHLRQVDQRPRQRDPLLHPARELIGAAVGLGGQADALELGLDPFVDLVPRNLLSLEPEAHVLADVQVREERVALEDGVRRPLVRRQLGHVVIVDQDLPGIRLLEPGHHAQRRRLAAAGRAEQREELAAGQFQVQVVDRDQLAEALRHALQRDARLRCPGAGVAPARLVQISLLSRP